MNIVRWWSRWSIGVVVAGLSCGAEKVGPSVAPPSGPAPDYRLAADPLSSANTDCFACRDGRTPLEAWKLQSSASVKGAGKEVSSAGFSTEGWYPVTVPSTVLAALVANRVYPDPYVGKNLQAIPRAPFNGSWWYRTEFTLPEDAPGRTAWLDLDGVNYKANVWLNGHLVAASKDLVGTFTTHEWNVTEWARAGQPNALAVEVFAPDLAKDLALNWLDWNPAPPDRDMGIWRSAYVKTSGPIAVRETRVVSQLTGGDTPTASLTIKAELRNVTDRSLHVTALAKMEGIALRRPFDLAPHERKTVTFDASTDPALKIDHPRLWWPAQMGTPEQYDLAVSAEIDGKESDRQPVRFGIREVTFDLDEDGFRVFRVNGKRILIRGGGWAPDMMLRSSRQRLEAELRYVRDLNLNAIRLEGKLESDDFYAMCDAYGILTIPGWMCCDRWQKCGEWTGRDHRIAVASMESEARRLRNHPSVVDFLIGSDEAPPPNVEKEFLEALKGADWPNPISPSASDRKSPALGPSGVKMTGPYDWVAPVFWYRDVEHRTEKGSHGGAFGFNTETGPGPAIPELESLRSALTPPELFDLWTKPAAKQFHAGTLGRKFDNLTLFNEALAARHGKPSSLEDYVRKAQLMNYEAERAMFEAFGRNKYAPATGVIHWMLNNAWPSLIWHLYGEDLAPAAGYFGAKKGNETLHVQYSYDDRSVVVVNHGSQGVTGLTVEARVYDRDGSEKFAETKSADVAPDGVTRVTTLPAPGGLSGVYFVKLDLFAGKRQESSNFYWLSRKEEIVDFDQTDWYFTPTKQFADYSELLQLADAEVDAAVISRKEGERGESRVTLENRSSSVAFFIRLNVTAGREGNQVVPVLWEDNYVSLLPKEKRGIAVRYRMSDVGGPPPAIEVSGWNVRKRVLGG